MADLIAFVEEATLLIDDLALFQSDLNAAR